MLNSESKKKSIDTLKKEYEDFFRKNYSRLYYYALHFIPNSEICKDIVSDSFYYLWERIDTFRTETALRYMYTHVHHLCIDHIRHAKMKEANTDSYLAMLQKWNTQDWEESEERIRIIMRLIEEMPPATRQVMEQCYIHKKKYRHVAQMTGLSESGVRKHIMKGLNTIRSYFSIKYKKGSD